MSSDTYVPPLLLANPHIQATLSSSRIRRRSLAKRHAAFLTQAETLILQTKDGVRLAGELNLAEPKQPNKTLIILFHGWEGSSASNYVVSAAAQLTSQGFDTFRLNFRDHGDTHHLNKGIFNSTLVNEVADAIEALSESRTYTSMGIMGFSLGGSFALRVGLKAQSLSAPLKAILAVCPVLDPAHTMHVLETGPFWYEHYFIKKWKRSLFKKLALFPEYDYHQKLAKMKHLGEMNDYFIPLYTGYSTVEQYFDAYTITGDRLAATSCKTRIVSSEDDPVIPIADLDKIKQPSQLSISRQQYGSHCAFLQGLSCPSWIDDYAVRYFDDLKNTE